MTTPKRKIAQDAGRIESMMLKYQRQVGEVTSWHTIHDISFRTGLKTDAAKKAVVYLHYMGTLEATFHKCFTMYSLKGITK